MSDRPGIRFDPVINLGHICTAAVFLVTAAIGYANLNYRVEEQSRQVARIETGYREADKGIEAKVIDKINDQKTLIQNVSITTAANIAEIKSALIRIEEKLDHKADKPGYR